MSNAAAPNLVGEPLIQVIGESVTEASTTPELFTPPPQNSGHQLYGVNRGTCVGTRGSEKDPKRFVGVFLGRYSDN